MNSAQNIISWRNDEGTGTKRRPQLVSQGAALIGLDWQHYTPWKISKDDGKEYGLQAISYDQAKEFLTEHSSDLFGDGKLNPNFLMLETSPQKESYYQHYVDHFAITCGEEMIGYACINLQDWSSYYLRYINILPQYRGQQLVIDFVNFTTMVLGQHKIDRIETHVAAHNAGQMSKLVKLGFMVNGNYQSERWGSMTLLTKYLNDKYQQVFQRQFCL